MTVGAATIAGIVVALDWFADLNLFNLARWGLPELHAQNSPPVPAAPPTAQKQQSGTPATSAPTTAPSVPVRTERIQYNAWTVTCTDTVEKTSKKNCSAMLQLINQKQRNVILVWLMGRDNQGVLRSVIQSPTGVQIPKGIELKLGNGPTRSLPYVNCAPQKCEASINMDDAMVHDAKVSPDAIVTVYALDGRAINFKMEIKGIDKAFAALGK
jgi:invasion protein IalB